MLVLSRKLDEKIYIGTDIILTITKINGHSVGIGIEAPRHVEINRPEVKEKKDRDLTKSV